MEFEAIISSIILTLAIYLLPYVIVRLIHRRSFSPKAAKIMTIVWAIISAAIVTAIKFATSGADSARAGGLNVVAIFLWNWVGYQVLLRENKWEKPCPDSSRVIEPPALTGDEPQHKDEPTVKISNPTPEKFTVDPYNVDDVEVNIVKPKSSTTHTIDRKTKIALICMAIAIVLAVISAGVAISKSAAYNRVVSEKTEVQSSLDDVNDEYQALWDRYNQKLSDYYDLERDYKYGTQSEELSFYKDHAVCTNGGRYYHKYSCSEFSPYKSFWIYNTEAAESDGFRPCPECIG